MTEPRSDTLPPSSKDPAEGAREPPKGGAAVDAPEESHLGPAGDPAEGGAPKGGTPEPA